MSARNGDLDGGITVETAVLTSRKGCDPLLSTARGKLQKRRSKLNEEINRELRMRNGAENLFRATDNKRLKELVSVELFFFNSNIQLLKEEVSELNSSVNIYQHDNSTVVPMIPLGLKETKDVDFRIAIKDFIMEHYSEDAERYATEIQDLHELRLFTMVSTDTRKEPASDDSTDLGVGGAGNFNPPVFIPDDHNPYLEEDGFPAMDEDFRVDQDFRQDQDMRGDQIFRQDQDMRGIQDFNGDIDFRSRGGMGPPPQGMDNMSQGQFNSGQFGGDGSNRSGQFRGRCSRRGHKRDRHGGDDNEDHDNRPKRGSLLGDMPAGVQWGHPENCDIYINIYNGDYNMRDHCPSPRAHNRRDRGGQDGYRARGRGNSRYEDCDRRRDSKGSGGGYKGNNPRGGRGKFRGSDCYRGGGGRGGRGNWGGNRERGY